jgi:hypothetical protein
VCSVKSRQKEGQLGTNPRQESSKTGPNCGPKHPKKSLQNKVYYNKVVSQLRPGEILVGPVETDFQGRLPVGFR